MPLTPPPQSLPPRPESPSRMSLHCRRYSAHRECGWSRRGLGKASEQRQWRGKNVVLEKRTDLSRQAPWRHGLWSRRLVTPLEHEWYKTMLCGGAECRARTFCRRHGRGVGRCVGKHLKNETGGVGAQRQRERSRRGQLPADDEPAYGQASTPVCPCSDKTEPQERITIDSPMAKERIASAKIEFEGSST